LVEENQEIGLESKQHPKENKSLKFKWYHEISSGITSGASFSSLKQAMIKEEASQPQQEECT